MAYTEGQRIAKYTRDYFTKRKIPEIQSWHKRIIRTDVASCLCYALGYRDKTEIDLLRKMSGNPYREHLMWIGGRKYRTPKLVIDIGTGRGEIPALFSLLDIRAIGVDPSPGSFVLFPLTMKTWANATEWEHYHGASDDALKTYLENGVLADTIIMCESLEHIKPAEFERTWDLVCEMLTQTQGLFIVANWIKNHPIRKDGTGYDHIRRVDDALYDRLATKGKTIVRRGSHLVLQFGQ